MKRYVHIFYFGMALGLCVTACSLDAVLIRWGDTVESKIDVIDVELSILDMVVDSQLDVIESKVDSTACGTTSLDSSDISGGTITLSTAGSYCLSEDVTADISITMTSVSLDLTDRTVTGSISITGDDVFVKNGTLLPPAPTVSDSSAFNIAGTRADITNVTIKCSGTTSAVNGRDGIRVQNSYASILHCTVIAGNAVTSGTFLIGGDGLYVSDASADYVHVEDCFFQGGNGADSSVLGGSGGAGIHINGNQTGAQLVNCACLGGNGGDDSSVTFGGVGGSGIFIEDTTNTEIKVCKILSTGTGGNPSAAGGQGIAISNTASDIAIQDCVIGDTGSGGPGGAGGNGILIDNTVSGVTIQNCLISSTGGGAGTTGGNGIRFQNTVSDVTVQNCLIRNTGSGTTGGHGVKIDSTVSDISVQNCVIRDTGTGSSAATNGKAIDDDVAVGATESKIFGNVAHNIANAIKFDLQASGIEKGFSLSNPPSSTAVSVYANVFL